MWIGCLPKVLEDANNIRGSGSNGDNSTTMKVQMWLSRLNAMLALYTIILEDEVDNNNNDSGEVNWLSNIGTMEVKWLEVKGKFSELEGYYDALLSFAQVRSGRFLILNVSFFFKNEFSLLFVGFSRASSSYAIHSYYHCCYFSGKIVRYTSLHPNSLQR